MWDCGHNFVAQDEERHGRPMKAPVRLGTIGEVRRSVIVSLAVVMTAKPNRFFQLQERVLMAAACVAVTQTILIYNFYVNLRSFFVGRLGCQGRRDPREKPGVLRQLLVVLHHGSNGGGPLHQVRRSGRL